MSQLPLPRASTLAPAPVRSTTGKPGNVGGMLGGILDVSAMARMTLGSDPRISRPMGGSLAPNRRSSTFASRPSIAIGAGMAITKDPRPIRDKSWQNNAVKTLINFLVQAGYNQTLSAKALQAPSVKDFQSIFKFLYAQLDPQYVWQKKFEEEVPVILRGLRYPFCDQISKSHLTSVGTMHAWPLLLAMLTWMVELILCCDQMDNNYDIDDMGSSEVNNEKVFFDYLTKAYAVFLAGDDNYDAMDQELISTFDRKNESIVREVEKLKDEHENLNKEWTNLRENDSPLTKAERESTTIQSDIEKFKQYIAHLEIKKQKLEDQVKGIEEDLVTTDSELTKMSVEKVELQKIVDMQEISPADVDRMTAERDQLARTLEAVAIKTDESNKAAWEKEITLRKTIDQCEKNIQEFNLRAYRLGLHSAHNPDSEGVNFELILNVHGDKIEEIISEDLKSRAKPILMKLRAKYNATLHKLQDELIALQETIDRLSEASSEKLEELILIESRIAQLNQQYEEEREQLAAMNAKSSEEMQSLERDMQKMRLDSTATLAASQQKVQKASIEFEQMQHRYQDRRGRLLKEVFKTMEDIITFKEHIGDRLKEVCEVVRGEVTELTSAA
ncbi:kinetochore-associated Ndc80 complex subunit ndc80 [Irineochytrium annulatum]|nr:kinetochore-associated Ndc80 complex subunit ndc80 [Irineochytrium annulatum]